MKAQKDIRTTLAGMNAAGLVAMQEVPKGSDRAPMRTYYLW
jgi:DNA-directed RNA polymerase III subunit RPC3